MTGRLRIRLAESMFAVFAIAAFVVSIIPARNWIALFFLLFLLFFGIWAYAERIRATRLQRSELGLLVKQRTAGLEYEKNRAETAVRQAEEARKEAERQREIIEQAMIIIQENQEDLIMTKNAAEESSRAKSHFLATMSHELRTPLSAIIGYSEILRDEMVERGERQWVSELDKIQLSGRHLLRIVSEILDLSKIEAGKMELFLETFDLSSLIREVTSTVEPLIGKNRNRLLVKESGGLGFMRADETRVRQILINLLGNASKFTRNGIIELETFRESLDGSDWVIFRISDSGIGITEDQMPRMFQFFSQADASTSRKFGGTGLGLALSQRFCRLMGGEIKVESKPNKGSVFTVHLPAEVLLTRDESIMASSSHT